ncbi:galactosylceramide sulfotransferase-like [Ptychodera flava]|uniref:galactosylceramide sulfotransferase-like n=1 Tax=Ptychodera flava TaxID=63121 RepID=UPI00396A3767
MMENSKPNEQLKLKALSTDQHSPKKEKQCKPIRKFIYIKTVKTGSSTLACILFRYGLKNGLIAAVEQRGSPVINFNFSSKSYNIVSYNCKNFTGFDLIANQIIYRRAEMEKIVKDAKYITILRSPYTRIRSNFFYSNKFEHLRNSPSDSNPFLAYLKSLEPPDNTQQKCCESREGSDLSHRLGVCATKLELLNANIRQLDRELDLVLLNEYYDESLILLKKIMCWEFEDIVYYPQNVNKNRLPPITGKMKNIIDKIAIADMQLYNHFNKTFWEKVKNYDGDFEADLAKYRNIKKRITEECENEPTSDYCNLFYMDATPMTKVVYDKQLNLQCSKP